MSRRTPGAYWLAHFGEDHPAAKVTDAQRAEGIRRIVEDYDLPKCVAMDLGVKSETVCTWVRAAGYVRGYVKRRQRPADGRVVLAGPGVMTRPSRENGGHLSRSAGRNSCQ